MPHWARWRAASRRSCAPHDASSPRPRASRRSPVSPRRTGRSGAGRPRRGLRPAGRGINLEDTTTRRSIAILGGIVGIVLLIACVNLTGLMLARGLSRQHEFSVRAALGASRAQLVRLAFIESAMLALAGAALGLGLVLAGPWTWASQRRRSLRSGSILLPAGPPRRRRRSTDGSSTSSRVCPGCAARRWWRTR
jgi:hypothetical protein